MLSDDEVIYAKSLVKYCDDPIPGYFEFMNKTWISFQEFGLNFTRYPVDYDFPAEMIRAIKLSDVSIVFALAIMFTILRIFLSRLILIPFAKWMQVKSVDYSKFNESSFKFIMYLLFWSLERWIVVTSGNYSLLAYPLRVWKNMTFTNDILRTDIQPDIYLLYVLQLGFYIHSIYAVFKLDAWRTDSIMLFVHHFLTIFLLEFSFIMRYHQVGALVLYLHDIADVLLEFTKMNVYLKSRNVRFAYINKLLSDIGYVSFVSIWFWFRLYWYPLKVLHMTNWGVYITQIGKDPKMYVILNTMLTLLLFMNIYWFSICVRLGYKIATGQLKEVEDVRETDIDEEDKGRKSSKAEGTTKMNGKAGEVNDWASNNGDSVHQYQNGDVQKRSIKNQNNDS